ncbi:MAG: EAL domain-containing protein [Lachnospiraceae bacterium]|nr:EAL domain-containing protein [Lachnospiraceae bacterium]
MVYNVDFEICTIIFMIFFMFIVFGRKSVADLQNRIFRIYFIVSFLNTCLDVVSCMTVADVTIVPLWLNYIMNMLFLSFQCIIPTIFLLYVYFKVQRIEANVAPLPYFIWMPAIIGITMVVTSYWTRFIFYFDSTGYQHGRYHSYLYINVAFYALASVIYMIKNNRILKHRQCMITLMIIACALAPTIVQFFLPQYMLAGVGTALSIFVMYFTDENQEIYEDTVTSALNREAFIQHVNINMDRKLPEQIFVIALDNFKLINEIHGVDGGNEIMQMMVTGLTEEYGENRIYRFGGDIFIVVLEEKTEGAKEYDRIRRIVQRRMHLSEGGTVELSACICLLHTIHIPESMLVQTIEQAVAKVKRKGKGRFLEVDEDATADMHRTLAIEQALISAVESGRFEVHYQPIIDTHTKKFHSMEALARLNVYGYGYVSPEEFILIAERNGTILQIGLIVLEEVCRFISGNNLAQKGIEFIEVNLSVVQCMQDTICQDILRILKKYDVPPKMINLEITESAAADSEEKLIRNMARLALTDITFSLDDYGSGFSNINYIVDLPFSIVKLDKYIVWAAMKNITSRRILEHTIAMFKAIHLKVVAEGIEDLEMAKTITDMGADYLQGFYFSRPVPKDQLLLCLEDEYLEKKLHPEKKADKDNEVNPNAKPEDKDKEQNRQGGA